MILLAATVRPTYEAWLGNSIAQGEVGAWLSWIPTSFGPLVPDAYADSLAQALQGFTGFPEFALLALTFLVGSIAMAFRSHEQEDDGSGSIITFAVARTIIAFLVVIPLLLLTSAFSDSP